VIPWESNIRMQNCHGRRRYGDSAAAVLGVVARDGHFRGPRWLSLARSRGALTIVDVMEGRSEAKSDAKDGTTLNEGEDDDRIQRINSGLEAEQK